MERSIDHYLIEWKERENHKPLILRGARQVGKTYAVDKLAASQFDNYIKINLEEEPMLKGLFEQNNVDKIIEELSVYFGKEIIPNKTLVFIDEIQTSPKAIQVLRYFYERYPTLHVIAAGSLLDHALNEINYSMPVGRVEYCYMYPLSFYEFLNAVGEDKLVNYIIKYRLSTEFSELLHTKIMGFLRLYYFIGGMPEAVKSYVNNKQLNEITRIQNDIITSFKLDFSKYGNRRQLEYLQKVFSYSALNSGKKVKYVNIDSSIRSDYLKDAYKKLNLSRIIHQVVHTNSIVAPLTNGIDEKVFKTVFLDIGLANQIGGIQLIDLNKLITSHEGTLAEQFVGQELIVTQKEYIDSQLYYWVREAKSSNAEIDFLFQYKNSAWPVEVKAGKSGTLKSMHVHLSEKNIHMGIRFNADLPSIGNFTTVMRNGKELNYKLLSLPIYMAGHLNEILQSYFEAS